MSIAILIQNASLNKNNTFLCYIFCSYTSQTINVNKHFKSLTRSSSAFTMPDSSSLPNPLTLHLPLLLVIVIILGTTYATVFHPRIATHELSIRNPTPKSRSTNNISNEEGDYELEHLIQRRSEEIDDTGSEYGDMKIVYNVGTGKGQGLGGDEEHIRGNLMGRVVLSVTERFANRIVQFMEDGDEESLLFPISEKERNEAIELLD